MDERIGAKAIQAQQKVFFKPDVNQRGAVEIHTPEGIVLKSSVLGLSYFDSLSGQMVTLATTHHSVGELLEPNQIIYRDAFDNIHADVLYTFRTSGLEQDIIFRENPPAPELFGLLPESTKLEVMTEFYETPTPGKKVSVLDKVTDPNLRQQMAEPDWIDERLNFGNVILPRGKAFSVATAKQNEIIPTEESSPVGKRWINNGARSALIESVEYYNVRSILETLPDALSPNDLQEGDTGAMLNLNEKFPKTASRILPELNTSTTASLPREAIRLASYSPYEQPGFVLDYTTLSTGGDFTFSGNETYYVTSDTLFIGSVTFEGGTVIKYNPSTKPYLYIIGSLINKAETYLPVLITAKDDNTIGEKINGSSGSPSGYCSEAAIWYSTSGNAQIVNFHIRFAEIGIKSDSTGASTLDVINCQFVSNDTPIAKYGGTLNVENCLMVDNGSTVIEQVPSAGVFANLVNCTVDGGTTLYDTYSLSITNSIITGVTATGSPSNTDSVILSSSSGVYDSVGAGDYYLPATSPYKDDGTDAIDVSLVAELRKRTTSAPVEITSDITEDTTWGQVADRDIGNVDLGYHYPVIDYLSTQRRLDSSDLTILPGVVLATGGYEGIRIFEGSKIFSQGSINNPVVITHYYNVQESNLQLGSKSITTERFMGFWDGYSYEPEGNFNFTKFYKSAGSIWHLHTTTSWSPTSLIITNCEFYNCETNFGGASDSVITLKNNLFVNVDDISLSGTGDMFVENNLFFTGSVSFNQTGSGDWYFYNNVFDNVTFNSTTFANMSHSNNGYIGSGQQTIGASSSNVIVATFEYSEGPFGKFYQSSDDFINEGSGNADDEGLYHFTASVTNEKEQNSIIDIGYHYPATNHYFRASEGYSTTSMGPWRYEYTSTLQGLPGDLFLTWQSGNSWWGGVSGESFCFLRGDNGHPGQSHDIARSFIIPYAGEIMINGSVSDNNYCSGSPNEDGVKVRILKNSSVISGLDWTTVPANSSGVDMETSSPVQVSAGDIIYFQVNRNASNSCDSTGWDPVIYYTAVDEEAEFLALADHDGDGIADIFEDADGDGVLDSGETDWKESQNTATFSNSVIVFTNLE